MKKIKILSLGSLLVVSSWATADVSYSNFGVGYATGDNGPIDVDGFDLRGSFAINSSVHLIAGYLNLDQDPTFGFIVSDDLEILNFGAGWHTGLNEAVDFVATASILDIDTDFGSNDGIRLTGGVRGMAGDEFEFNADLVFEDIDDADDDTGYEIGGRYFFNRDTSVGVTLRDVSDLELIRIDVRFDY